MGSPGGRPLCSWGDRSRGPHAASPCIPLCPSVLSLTLQEGRLLSVGFETVGEMAKVLEKQLAAAERMIVVAARE